MPTEPKHEISAPIRKGFARTDRTLPMPHMITPIIAPLVHDFIEPAYDANKTGELSLKIVWGEEGIFVDEIANATKKKTDSKPWEGAKTFLLEQYEKFDRMIKDYEESTSAFLNAHPGLVEQYPDIQRLARDIISYFLDAGLSHEEIRAIKDDRKALLAYDVAKAKEAFREAEKKLDDYDREVRAIEYTLDMIVATNNEKSELVKNGKPSLMGWFTGQVMKATAGKLSPSVVQSVVKAKFGYAD